MLEVWFGGGMGVVVGGGYIDAWIVNGVLWHVTVVWSRL